MAIPTTCNPCGPYFFCKSTNHGISILQGSHHVAQKLSRTALPRKSESFTVLPSSEAREKSGASWPCNLLVPPREAEVLWRAFWMPNTSMSEITTATTIRMTGSRFTKLLYKTKRFNDEK